MDVRACMCVSVNFVVVADCQLPSLANLAGVERTEKRQLWCIS